MKKATLKVVDKKPDGVSAEDYKAAKKRGDVECNFVTAIENVRQSGGLYEIKVEQETVEVELKTAKLPEDMSKEELVAEMTAFGKPPRKQMSRDKAVEFIRTLREEAVKMITDE